jgi:hypothetical protein
MDTILSVLLKYCCNHDSVQNPNMNQTTDSILDVKCISDEIILFIGYFTINNKKGQQLFTNNTKMFKLLLELPMFYFVIEPEILFPTLISICFNNEENKTLMKEDLNLCFIRNFIQKTEEKVGRFSLSQRFPSRLTVDSLSFFSDELNKN